MIRKYILFFSVLMMMFSLSLRAEATTVFTDPNDPCDPHTVGSCGASILVSEGGTLDTPGASGFTITDCIYTGYAPQGGCSGSPDTSTGLRTGLHDHETSTYTDTDGCVYEAVVHHDGVGSSGEPKYVATEWTEISCPGGGGGATTTIATSTDVCMGIDFNSTSSPCYYVMSYFDWMVVFGWVIFILTVMVSGYFFSVLPKK